MGKYTEIRYSSENYYIRKDIESGESIKFKVCSLERGQRGRCIVGLDYRGFVEGGSDYLSEKYIRELFSVTKDCPESVDHAYYTGYCQALEESGCRYPFGLTDDEDPFRPGELIEFSGDKFIVLSNDGDGRGEVREGEDGNGDMVGPFYWEFSGEKCKRVLSVGRARSVNRSVGLMGCE